MHCYRGKCMPMNQHGFSLTEVLIAMAISSILLLSTSRFLPELQRAVLLQSSAQEREEEGSGNVCSRLASSYSARVLRG